MKLKLLVTLVSLSIAAPTYAQIFRIKVTNYGAGAGNASFESFVNSEIQTLQDQINGDLPSADPARLMKGMADSSVFAGKGIGTDYASAMEVMLIGAGVGVGADLAKSQTGNDGKDTISGVGVAPGVVLGANLGFLGTNKILGLNTKKLNLYFNFLGYSHKQVINDKVGEKSSASVDMTTMGVHFRYDWIKGNNRKLLGWGGVKIHWGYEYNKTDISFSSELNKAENSTSSGGETISGTITGNPLGTINTSTHSIPLTISTDIRLLYFLSLYTGLGADYNWGQATGKGNLNADASNLNCTGGACGGGTTVQVQTDANINATGKVNPFSYRGLAGLQFNLPFLRIFAQVDKSLSNDLIGATAGVRFVY